MALAARACGLLLVLAACCAETDAWAVAPSVAGGLTHSCAIDSAGSVFCWGDNSHGQLGLGTPSATLVDVVGLSDAIAISTGQSHACALTSEGVARCWGDNSSGQLGNGSTISSSVPVTVPGLPALAAIAAGGNHTCALTRGGAVLCWGDNFYGQLGPSAGSFGSAPAAVAGLPSGVTSIASGASFTCALTGSGSVYCWGGDFSASPAAVPGLASIASISAGSYHVCALTQAGAVICAGSNSYGQLGNGTTIDSSSGVAVTLPARAIAVGSGGQHTCAVLASGGVYCWGYNADGELGNGTDTDSHVPVAVSTLPAPLVAISAGESHTCGTTSVGAVVCWGYNGHHALANGSSDSSLVPSAATQITAPVAAIDVGDGFSCALQSGKVLCWGDDSSGELGIARVLASATPVKVQGLPEAAVALSAGGENSNIPSGHTCALTVSGQVWCWGADSTGQLGDGNFEDSPVPVRFQGLSSPAASVLVSGVSTCVAMVDGNMTCVGFYPSLSVPFPTGVKMMSMGVFHICVLTNDGRVLCWGDNGWDQLARDSPPLFSSDVPLEIQGLPFTPTTIASGDRFTCALSPQGAAWCWGSNRFGELGDGSDPRVIFQKAAPVPVTGLGSGVTAITGGSARACALIAEGRVSCWGVNYRGELGTGSTLQWSETPVSVAHLPSTVKSLASGVSHTCAITSDALPLCWGANDASQLGEGTLANRSTPKIVRSEGATGTLQANNWFLDLNRSLPKTIPDDFKPTFLATAQGDVSGEKANVDAQVQFRAGDLGHPIYVYGYVPAALLASQAQAGRAGKDGSSCVLVQLTPDGVPQPASASTLQAYVGGVAGTQQQGVNVLRNVPSGSVAGSTFCVGTAGSSSQAVSTANSQCVATVPPGQRSPFVCAPPDAAAANLPASLSGLWWNAAESGWGIHFTQRSNNVFAAWYTYGSNGAPKWFVSTCAMPAGTTGTAGTCNGAIYEVSGPTFFGAAFNPQLANAVQNGSLSVNFQNADNASMTYSGVSGQTRTVPITRQPLASGTPPGVNYTDIWWGGASESGWGMAVAQQASTVFLAWYVYDNSGKPMWYVATCALNGTTCSGDLLRTTGPAWGPTFNSSQVQAFTAGTVSVNFTDANNATLNYTVGGVTGSKTIMRQLF